MFIWMISGNKRIAYQRVPAREIVYSIVEEERGKHCGKQQILLLRVSTVAIWRQHALVRKGEGLKKTSCWVQTIEILDFLSQIKVT